MAPQAVALTGVTPGRPTRAGQTVTLHASTDHPEFFDIAGEPSVAPDGTLTFTPAQGAFGTATVTVTAQDDGGTANGGEDTASISFQIVIAPLPPNAADDSYSTTDPHAAARCGTRCACRTMRDVNSTTLTVTPATFTTAHRVGHDQRRRIVRLPAGTVFLSLEPTRSRTRSPAASDRPLPPTVTISVTAVAPTTSTLYLSTSGLSTEVWDLSPSAPACGLAVPDPGTATAHQADDYRWRRQRDDEPLEEAADLDVRDRPDGDSSLDGPLTLHLTAATANFDHRQGRDALALCLRLPRRPSPRPLSTTCS